MKPFSPRKTHAIDLFDALRNENCPPDEISFRLLRASVQLEKVSNTLSPLKDTLAPLIALTRKAHLAATSILPEHLVRAPLHTPLESDISDLVEPHLTATNPTPGHLFFLPSHFRVAILSESGTLSEHLPRRATVTAVRTYENKIISVSFEHDLIERAPNGKAHRLHTTCTPWYRTCEKATALREQWIASAEHLHQTRLVYTVTVLLDEINVGAIERAFSSFKPNYLNDEKTRFTINAIRDAHKCQKHLQNICSSHGLRLLETSFTEKRIPLEQVEPRRVGSQDRAPRRKSTLSREEQAQKLLEFLPPGTSLADALKFIPQD